MTDYLLDSGFLYASIDESDKHHESVKDIARRIRGNIILPIPAITEETDIEAKEDYRKLLSNPSSYLHYLQTERDEIFFIDKDWFDEKEKLMEVHYIYDYLVTFVFISESKTRLLLVDYFYD
jgi:predicted nucleic acid-binding protein